MPPRLFAAGIVLFWLSTTSWLFFREIWPHLNSDEPPAFTLDLTDEVGANVITWKMYSKDKRIGDGTYMVRRLRDRTFEIYSELRFSKEPLPVFIINIHKIAWTYHVTDDGNLLALDAKVRYRSRRDADNPRIPETEFAVTGTVEEGLFQPTLMNDGHVLLKPEPVSLSRMGRVVNPMGMINRIDGLRTGRSWSVTLLDSMPKLDNMPVGLPGKDLLVPRVLAEVHDAELEWPSSRPVDCYRIDYSDADGNVLQSTWVHRYDGRVLKQHVRVHGRELTLIRDNK